MCTSLTSVTPKPEINPNVYSVVRKIGEGAYAEVVEVTNSSGSRFALKYFKDATPESREEAAREIANLKKLENAPHVVQYIQHFKYEGQTAILLELIEDGDLARQYKRFTIQKIATTVKQIVEALAYCHERGLTHCDLKLENILWDKTRGVKLSDLGAMRHISDPPTDRLVTMYNRPLEVFLGGPYDTSVDMWGMGTLLIRLLAYKNLFSANGINDIDDYWDYFILNLQCLQCGYPPIEFLKTLHLSDHFFTFKNNVPKLKYPIPIVFTPWQEKVQVACKKRGFPNFTTRSFIKLISQCLKHTGRITALEALTLRVFNSDIPFSVAIPRPLQGASDYAFALHKKNKQKTCVLQVNFSDLSSLKCLHLLSRYPFRKCMAIIHQGGSKVHERAITIKRGSVISITGDKDEKDRKFQIKVLKTHVSSYHKQIISPISSRV